MKPLKPLLHKIERLNEQAAVEALAQRAVDEAGARMILLHTQKPWIPDFLTSALSPLRGGLSPFFKEELFEIGGRHWFYPSTLWWKAHAKASHPPDGSGCDSLVHTAFLSREGKNAEFLYSAILRDGRIIVLGGEDFLVECAFWKKNF